MIRGSDDSRFVSGMTKGLVMLLKSHDEVAAVITRTDHSDGHHIHQGNAHQHSLHYIQPHRHRPDGEASIIVKR